MVRENFQICSAITGRAYSSQKIALLMPPDKIFPQVPIITSLAEGNYLFPKERFFFSKIYFPQQKGEGGNYDDLTMEIWQ